MPSHMLNTTAVGRPANRHSLRATMAAAAAIALVLVAGCGNLPRNAVPEEQSQAAVIPNMPDVRSWARQPNATLERDLVESFSQESPGEFPTEADGTVRYAHLALSGGGASGAFGAGFLNGWTSLGTRPVFKIVTGVSTGALMAPFAPVCRPVR